MGNIVLGLASQAFKVDINPYYSKDKYVLIISEDNYYSFEFSQS